MAAPILHTSDTQTASGGTSSGTVTVTKPTNTVEGDLLLIRAATYTSPAVASSTYITQPTGFNLIRNTYASDSSARPQLHSSYKIAGASEPSTYDLSVEAGASYMVTIARITGHDATTPIETSNELVATSSDTPPLVLPALTVNADSLLLAILSPRANAIARTFTWPSPMTEESSYSQSNFTYVATGEEDITSAGSTGTRSVSYDGGTVHCPCQIISINSTATRNVPDVSPLYYGASLLANKTGIFFKVTEGHTNLNGTVLASGTNGTTDASGNFVLPAGVTMNDGGTPTAVDAPITLHLYWEEGSNPAVDRSLIVQTTAVAEA